jgi:hypothetical protein
MLLAFLIRHEASCPIHFTFFVKWVGNHFPSLSEPKAAGRTAGAYFSNSPAIPAAACNAASICV